MVAKLVAEEGDLKGLVLSLDEGDSWIIGRDPEECQLVIEDPLTSRKHLIARRNPQGNISVENLSHTNPIQVNDEFISQARVLNNGDTVKIGSELFRFYSDAAARIFDENANDDFNNDAIPLPPIPNVPPKATEEEKEEIEDETNDTVFDGDQASARLADINFGLTETGRWLLKVIGGPNNGAEFYMQTGSTYVVGTDPHSCDIVFHDTSVSRQHARITVTEDDSLLIEDLKSRNGVLINNEKLTGKQVLSPSVIVTTGTTSFVVYDREGEMQTIISPLLPSIVKVLQQDEAAKQAEKAPIANPETPSTPPVNEVSPEPAKASRGLGPLILLTLLLGLFSLGGLATYSLFKSEPIVKQVEINANELLDRALAAFPAVKYSYNKANGSLLLLGHVSNLADKNQLMYELQVLNFIKSIDDSGLIIDEYVWRELNSVLTRNPAWQGISIHSPTAGEFTISGYLQTRKQADMLSDYMSVNFPYLDLLNNQVIVEEDVLSQINSWLQQTHLRHVTPKIAAGEISLNGSVPANKMGDLNQIVQKIKQIPGVRIVNNFATTQAEVTDVINISDQYVVTGQSRVGNKYTVIVNGRIVSEGDVLDGMAITQITSNGILLERDGAKFRIDYNK